MKILRYLLRQTQQSIICAERSETLAIFEVIVDGTRGYAVGGHDCYKRDVESDWHASSEELAKKLGVNELIRLYEQTWGTLPPKFTSPTEFTQDISRIAKFEVRG